MLTGPELGAALARAMDAKGVTQSTVADEFGIKQPSVSEWLKYGRIGKRHLTHLVEYFGGVVGPQHWGLPANWTSAATPAQPLGTAEPRAPYSNGAPPPLPNRKFDDRRAVSDTDWAVLQAVKLVMSDAELERIKTDAERIRRMAAEQIAAANEGRSSPDKE